MKSNLIIPYALIMAFRTLLRLMPRRVALWHARRLGDFIRIVDKRHSGLVLKNLNLAYKDELTSERKNEIVKAVYRHFSSMLADLLRSKIDTKYFEKFVTVEGLENIQAADQIGKGVIYLTAHYGNWELFALTTGQFNFPLHALARELDNPLLEKVLASIRTQTGNKIIHKQSAVRATIEVLKQQERVGILIDQNMNPGRGIFVDFFGIPACTSTVVSSLAVKMGTPIVPCFVIPEPGNKWRVTFQKPRVYEREGNAKEQIALVTQELTTLIEEQIRAKPEVWLWMHKRWKTRPSEDEGSFY